MKKVLFGVALLLAPVSAYAADAPAAPPAPAPAPAPVQQLSADDAHNLMVLLNRVQMQGSEAMTVARLMAILNGIAEKK